MISDKSLITYYDDDQSDCRSMGFFLVRMPGVFDASIILICTKSLSKRAEATRQLLLGTAADAGTALAGRALASLLGSRASARCRAAAKHPDRSGARGGRRRRHPRRSRRRSARSSRHRRCPWLPVPSPLRTPPPPTSVCLHDRWRQRHVAHLGGLVQELTARRPEHSAVATDSFPCGTRLEQQAVTISFHVSSSDQSVPQAAQ